MKIKKIKLSNFRSFTDPAEIEFAGPGLYCIKGFNTETGSSSGAGKSNFHYAISHLLGYCPVPATELQTYLTDTRYKVEGWFELDGKEVYISRGDKVKFKIDGEPEVTGATPVNQSVEQLLKINPELVKALTFRPQRSFGAFFSKTDQEKKTFLSSVLNLEVFSKARVECREKIRHFERQISSCTGAIEALQNSLSKPEEPDFEKLEETLKDKEKRIAHREKLTEESKESLITLATKRSNLQALQKKFDEEKDRQFNLKLKDLDDQSKDIQLNVTKISRRIFDLEKEAALVKAEYQKKEGQIESSKVALQKLEDGECPVCQQSWSGADGHYEMVKTQNRTYEREVFALYQRIDKIRQEKEQLSAQSLEFSKKLNAVELKRKTIREDVLKVIEPIKDEIGSCHSDIEQLERYEKEKIRVFNRITEQINALNETINKLNQEKAVFERLNAVFEETTAKINTQQLLLDAASSKFETEQHFETLCKDFVSYLFSEVLNEISIKTTNAMSRIPNVRDVSVSFEVLDVVKGAGLKAEIRPVIKKGQYTVSSKSGLSGGQFSSLELILDLIISQIISQRMGKRFDWLILDEPFDGMGTADKEASLELIRQMCPDKVVLIIDHSVDIHGHFDKIVEIEYNQGVSKIVGISEVS
jgi:DNA repair exonuclease SbcCD ATPase subunit